MSPWCPAIRLPSFLRGNASGKDLAVSPGLALVPNEHPLLHESWYPVRMAMGLLRGETVSVHVVDDELLGIAPSLSGMGSSFVMRVELVDAQHELHWVVR